MINWEVPHYSISAVTMAFPGGSGSHNWNQSSPSPGSKLNPQDASHGGLRGPFPQQQQQKYQSSAPCYDNSTHAYGRILPTPQIENLSQASNSSAPLSGNTLLITCPHVHDVGYQHPRQPAPLELPTLSDRFANITGHRMHYVRVGYSWPPVVIPITPHAQPDSSSGHVQTAQDLEYNPGPEYPIQTIDLVETFCVPGPPIHHGFVPRAVHLEDSNIHQGTQQQGAGSGYSNSQLRSGALQGSFPPVRVLSQSSSSLPSGLVPIPVPGWDLDKRADLHNADIGAIATPSDPGSYGYSASTVAEPTGSTPHRTSGRRKSTAGSHVTLANAQPGPDQHAMPRWKSRFPRDHSRAQLSNVNAGEVLPPPVLQEIHRTCNMNVGRNDTGPDEEGFYDTIVVRLPEGRWMA